MHKEKNDNLQPLDFEKELKSVIDLEKEKRELIITTGKMDFKGIEKKEIRLINKRESKKRKIEKRKIKRDNLISEIIEEEF